MFRDEKVWSQKNIFSQLEIKFSIKNNVQYKKNILNKHKNDKKNKKTLSVFLGK